MYDSGNRLLQHYHQVDNNPEELLADNTYNELSQLSNKKVGSALGLPPLQSIDYTYNIRGWLSGINRDQMAVSDLGGKLFSYKIKYNEKEGITSPNAAQFPGKEVMAKYNGNIAEVDWRSVENIGNYPSLTPKRYGYVYDRLNRLTAGFYQTPNNPNVGENTESLEYDLNGNITKLFRTSVLEYGSTTPTKIDDLEYIYAAQNKGNKLITINDHSFNPTGYEGGGMKIKYDVNGNMTEMPDKGINKIDYNYLNLPDKINYSRGGTESAIITTKYSAEGVKLQKENNTTIYGFNGSTTTTKITDYLDGFQYLMTLTPPPPGGFESLMMASSETGRALERQAYSFDGNSSSDRNPVITKNQNLQFFPTAEGFYDYAKNQYIYQYKDHLGNVRVSFGRDSSGNLELVDVNDYYPFGMNHLKSGNSFFGAGSYKNYKYNGKELQETGMYDYGARFYMADIGRWGVVDPLAEDTEDPYNYAYNDPIDFVDPDGMEAEFVNGDDKKKPKESEIKEVNIKGRKSNLDQHWAIRSFIQGSGNTFSWMGQNRVSTRVKFNGATPGTSYASLYFRSRSWSNKSVSKVFGKNVYNKIPKKLFGAPLRTNKLGGLMGRTIPFAGRTTAIGLNYGISAYNIATADNKVKQTVRESGFLIGAEAGGTFGAEIGSVVGPVGTAVGGVVGSAVGGAFGGTATYEPCGNCILNEGLKMDGAIRSLYEQQHNN